MSNAFNNTLIFLERYRLFYTITEKATIDNSFQVMEAKYHIYRVSVVRACSRIYAFSLSHFIIILFFGLDTETKVKLALEIGLGAVTLVEEQGGKRRGIVGVNLEVRAKCSAALWHDSATSIKNAFYLISCL